MIDDKPVIGKAQSVGELMGCVVHPAFRLGFLDAESGRALDHDKIVERVFAETPQGALSRLGWQRYAIKLDGEVSANVELAQYRYEEGRTLFLEYGVRCKAWGHPDYPPVKVREFVYERAKGLPAPPLDQSIGAHSLRPDRSELLL